MKFTDKLTPGQVQQVMDALDIPWRDYTPNPDGWIDIDSTHLYETTAYCANSDVGINIQHGGFVDHYFNGDPVGRGDLVHLAAMFLTETFYKPNLRPEHNAMAIKFIKEVCGINQGIQPPEMEGGYQFANDWLKIENNNKYVRVPNDIWQSNLSASAKLVWMAIFSRIDKEGVYSFAGVRNISDHTQLSKTTVQRAINELEGAGLLIKKSSGIRQKMNKYPLAADLNTINKKLHEITSKEKSVPKFGTVCTKNGYDGVSKIGTELDSVNDTHLKKSKNIGAKQVCAHSFLPDGFFSDEYFSLFYQAYHRSQREYDTCLYLDISAESMIKNRLAVHN